jgi:hypothetical protein
MKEQGAKEECFSLIFPALFWIGFSAYFNTSLSLFFQLSSPGFKALLPLLIFFIVERFRVIFS